MLMATKDIQPPRQHTPLDDQIAEAEREVQYAELTRRLAFGAIVGFALIEICLITIPVVTHYKDWIAAPWIVGVAGLIIGVPFFGVGFTAEDSPFSRSHYIAAQTQLERFRVKKRERDIGRPKNRSASYERYKESMPDLIEHYRIVANHNRRIYNFLQAFIIIGALSASTLGGAFWPDSWARWTVTGITLAIGISSAIGSHFKLNERSTEMQKTADLIEIEFRAVEFGIGDYSELVPEEALRRFVEKVERIRAENLTKKRQLDQPSDLRFVDASSVG